MKQPVERVRIWSNSESRWINVTADAFEKLEAGAILRTITSDKVINSKFTLGADGSVLTTLSKDSERTPSHDEKRDLGNAARLERIVTTAASEK